MFARALAKASACPAASSMGLSMAAPTRALSSPSRARPLRARATSSMRSLSGRRARPSFRNLRSSWKSQRAQSSEFGPALATFTQGRAFSSGPDADVYGDMSRFATVLGGQWGDEGKGKLVDILAQRYDIIARFNGGANAGHTLVVDGQKFAMHLLPCGLLYPDKINVIGNGVVVHLPTMFNELADLTQGGIDWEGRLLVGDRAHLVLSGHQWIDKAMEEGRGKKSIGTTGRGIGPCYASKATREGARVGEIKDWERFSDKLAGLYQNWNTRYGVPMDLLQQDLDQIGELREKTLPMITDTVSYLNTASREGKTILAEGANAALLDMDFGTYPFVTSSNTTAGGIMTGLGMAPNKLGGCIGVVKAYTTRVGEGPFPTELFDEIGTHLGEVGHEFGTTTGRPRRCGWLDIPVANYGHLLNGYTGINITKLDVLSGLPDIKIGATYSLEGKELPYGAMPADLNDLANVEVGWQTMVGWEDDISKVTDYANLPTKAQKYVQRVEDLMQVPVAWVGVGPGREAMLKKPRVKFYQ